MQARPVQTPQAPLFRALAPGVRAYLTSTDMPASEIPHLHPTTQLESLACPPAGSHAEAAEVTIGSCTFPWSSRAQFDCGASRPSTSTVFFSVESHRDFFSTCVSAQEQTTPKTFDLLQVLWRCSCPRNELDHPVGSMPRRRRPDSHGHSSCLAMMKPEQHSPL